MPEPTIEDLDSKMGIIQLEPAKLKITRSEHSGADSEQSPLAQSSGPQGDSETIHGPVLPKEISDVRTKTFDQRFEELNRVPLFMRELDDSDGADGINTPLEALRSLAYEGEPHEIATNLKDNGNDSYRTKQWKDAIEYYGDALNLKCGRNEIDEACYVNRAACHLELHNYGKVLADCSKALSLNSKNQKALYRSAKACLALDRLEEAQDCITRGIANDPTGNAFQSILGQLEKKLQDALKKRTDEDARIVKQSQEANNLAKALKQRRYAVRESPRPPEMENARVCLSDPSDVESSLIFPTLFLYPLSYQTDFLAAFAEVHTLQSQLDLVLAESPPWDVGTEYTPTRVECYMETRHGGLVKFGRKVTLGTALVGGNVEVVDNLVRIYVLPKSKSAAWIEAFKGERAKTRGP